MWSNQGSIIVYITRNLRMQRRVKLRSTTSTTAPSEKELDNHKQESNFHEIEHAIPLSEEVLAKLKTKYKDEEVKIKYPNDQVENDPIQKSEKRTRKNLIDYKVKYPLTEPITNENQHEFLLNSVTPLYKLAYYQQLNLKQDHAKEVSQFLKKELRSAKVPLHPMTNRLLCPLDRVTGSSDIINYRNKDEFSVHIGADRNPKTVGYYVGHAKDPLMTCIPPTHLPIIRNSHKLIAHHFQEFIRASRHGVCLKFCASGVWKNLIVRSTLDDQRMASVIIYPKFLEDGDKEEIKEQLNTYFFHGPGSECELSSLYLQACPHTRCSRETAPYELIAGETHIIEQCLGRSIRISPDSFFQSNTKTAEILFETVMKLAEVSPLTTILDVCCNMGTLSNMIAPSVRGVIGIDMLAAAIEDAKLNSKENGITNTNFINGNIVDILPILAADLNECSEVIAIVNPGRGSLAPAAIDTIRNCKSIRKLIFVTTNPEGLASRNMAHLGTTIPLIRNRKSVLDGDPFVPTYMCPIDSTPQTLHLDYVILFERVNVNE